jgi:tetratricopeptide (TPR) repeat protein
VPTSLHPCPTRPLSRDLRSVLQIVIFAALCVGTSMSFAAIPDEMKVLIEKGKAKEAYELGNQHPELMGETLFDYYYGVAAVDSGRVSLGVLSLERVLLADPNNDLVRLELGRAYFALGEYQRAKEEFEEVKKHQPPAGVQATIATYLDAIKEKEGRYKPVYGAYIELGIGYNNNVNTAAAINNIVLPYWGPVFLAPSALPQHSVFSYDSVGANAVVPLATNVSGFVNVNTSQQRYSQISGYNLDVSNATTGVKYADGPNLYKIVAFGSLARLDQIPVPNTAGGGGEYVRQLTETQSIMLGGGSTRMNYATQYSAYDSTLNVGTVGYRKAFPTTRWKPVVDLGANYASQINTSNRPDLARHIGGGTAQLSLVPTDKWGVTVGAGYARSNYQAADIVYQAGRSDNLLSGNAVLQYKLTKELSARLEATYYNNTSNLPLYSYQQWTGALKLRYDWSSN